MTQPSSQGFTKFVVSVGALLVVAAFVVPGLILRDNDALTVSRAELRQLTSTGKAQIEHRQRVADDLGNAAPLIAAALLIAGGGLLAFGLPHLRRQEQAADERQAAETRKVNQELESQSPSEREERIEQDLASEPISTSNPEEVRKGSRAADLAEISRLEEAILSRLAVIAPPLYDFESHVKAPGSNLYLDGLLISTIDQMPDVVVEIKAAGRGAAKNARNRIMEAEAQLLRYMSRFQRTSIGWLILVLTEEISVAARDRIEHAAAADLENRLQITLIRPDDISALELPITP